LHLQDATGLGPVESGVASELSGLIEADARPGLTQAALALARVLDNPRVMSAQPAAAKVLVALLDKFSASARHRRGGLALVRSMTSGDDTAGA
jgi:hypothetical protein